MITLYGKPTSLFTAKVRLALRLKGLDWNEETPADIAGGAFGLLNPARTVPVLEHDGFAVTDSEAILEYLEEVFPEPCMLPGDARKRAGLRVLARFHDTRLEPHVRALFAHVAPSRRNAETVAAHGAVIDTRLNQFADLLDRVDHLPGADPTIADCGYPVTFTILDLLDPVLDLGLQWPIDVREYRAFLESNPVVSNQLAGYRAAIAGWIDGQRGG